MFLDSENWDADQTVIAERLMIVKSMTQIEEKTDDQLLQVPRELWSSSSSDIGKIKSATPIKVTLTTLSLYLTFGNIHLDQRH